ncbi:Alpha/Beta hydrolase protein [Ilyonectria destructans]|nr:Alpha/Beta hydrolase protein [Ilyonectria destructans]
MASLYTRQTLVIPASVPGQNEASIRHNLPTPLRLSAHDYRIRDADEAGFTIILTHGTSFNKHFWQLIIDLLLAQPELRSRVKRLIAIDAANHGDSAVLNKDALPPKAFWPDDSRDILHTLKYFGVEQPVIGIGHSFGGGAMCHAAMMEPEAFLATIFIEPILFQMKDQTEAVARMTMRRRDTWNSKEDLTAAFQKSASLQDWDKRQLQVYIEHGTFPIDGSATSPRMLKTPKNQEAATYLAAPYPEILGLIGQSRGRHHFVWGSESKVISTSDRESVARIIRAPSTTQVLSGAGHLVPMTHPEALTSILDGLLRDIPLPRRSSQAKL